MKVNEAPEKIYLSPITLEEVKNVITRPADTRDIEYTRTDAFIEKACEFIDGVIYDYIELKNANVDAFIDVDNKRFIDEFRNYMKEE